MTRLPLRAGLRYEDLPKKTREGIDLLEKAMNDPVAQTANKIMDAWAKTLTSAERHWLRYTEAGINEMWKRMGYANALAAKLNINGEKEKPR
jgi:hypothetical protein